MAHDPHDPPRDPDAMNTPTPPEVPQVPEPSGIPLPGAQLPGGVPGRVPGAGVPATTHIRCPNCNYNLTGITIGGTCPECGLVIGRGVFSAHALPTSGNAIASLVLGICSIVLGCMSYGLISLGCGPLAIFYAGRARKQIAAQEVSPSSEGLAAAGKITGIIGLCLAGLVVVFLVFMVVAMVLAG